MPAQPELSYAPAWLSARVPRQPARLRRLPAHLRRHPTHILCTRTAQQRLATAVLQWVLPTSDFTFSLARQIYLSPHFNAFGYTW